MRKGAIASSESNEDVESDKKLDGDGTAMQVRFNSMNDKITLKLEKF